MLTLPTKDLAVYKGQNKGITVNVANNSGVVDITDSDLSFNVKQTVSGNTLITKTTNDSLEIEKTAPTSGIAVIYILPVDTSSLSSGRYLFELWLTEAGGDTYPILTGYFWIQDVAPSMMMEVRKILGEAGELALMKVNDEMIYPAELNVIYTSRRRLKSVEGVWLLTDEDHTGTNYYTGGGFDADKGKIWLGTPLTATTQMVRVSYSWEAGLTDDAINHHLWSSRLYTINYTGLEFDYGDETTTQLQGAEAMAFARAMIQCILTVNGANVAQLGYNFRLDEFEIQTKLWGEGMIAEALFAEFRKSYEEWKMALGKLGTIVVATPEVSKYNLSELVGFTNSYSEGGED